MSIAHLGGLGNGGWRGALRFAQRQAPLRGEGLCEGGRGLPAEAEVGAFGVVVLAASSHNPIEVDLSNFAERVADMPPLFMSNGATATAAVAYDCSGVYVETDY